VITVILLLACAVYKMLEQYRYTPLPWESKPNTVRLIELLPGYGDRQIVCIVNEASLQDEPEYKALSYCWGNPNVQESIIIRDRHGVDFSLSVGTNLFPALHQLRDPRESKRLWADAICINQSDLDERRRQVLLMRQIYTGAEETWIWLGPSDENTWKAFSLMRKLVSAKNLQAANNDTRFYYEMSVQGQTEYGLPYILDSSFKSFLRIIRARLVRQSLDHSGSCCFEGSQHVVWWVQYLMARLHYCCRLCDHY
jgi:hypothetical protein